MTILDLMRLIQRHLKLVIALPIIFAVVALAYSFFIQASYTATANFITNGDLAFAQGLASKEATSYAKSGVQISCSSQSSNKQVTISATGSDATQCIEAANTVANNAVSQYKSSSSSVIATVTETTSAVRNTPSPLRVAVTAFALGLFVAICIVVLIDIAKAPIKSREDAENACELPVLGTGTSVEDGDRILANLQFACGKRPSTIAVVPIGQADSAVVISNELVNALERSSVRTRIVKGSPHARKFKVSVPEDAAVVVCCPPLAAGAGASYIANSSDATVLCVTEWTDSKRQLLATMRELELAKANIAGLAYLPEDKEAMEAARAERKAKSHKKK